MSRGKHFGRSTRRYKALRAAFRARCASSGQPCWLCGNPIDYALPVGHPDAFNLDHAVARSDRIELAEDPANFRASHSDCNLRRNNGEPFISIGAPSEAW